MRFEGKTALVVGGNSGIGLAAVKGLAADGAQVFLTGRSAETLKQTEADVPGARAFQADMADPDGIDPVLDAIRRGPGKLDVLMVNAGVGIFSPISQVTPELWDGVHDVNLRGAFFTAQKALPLMGKGGSIVFTGSIGAVLAMPGNVIYAAAKAGLIAVMKTFARELVEQGIRVNMVSPGPIETPIITRSGLDQAGIDAMRARMTTVVPMGRMGDPDECAAAMLFLASDEASFITGVDLFVDGGRVSLR
jgi:NAD(P)-dependent dehydrogenase (short-subunit alcohol dehydrogenase family)